MRSPVSTSRWEHFEHGERLGVRGFAPTKAGAFEQAALALTALVADPEHIDSGERVSIACEAVDDELLLATWLNAVVTEMALRRMVFGRFDIVLDGGRLQAHAFGAAEIAAPDGRAVEIHGATCTALRVAPSEGGGWLAQTVVDA